jgi:hypothetical protein
MIIMPRPAARTVPVTLVLTLLDPFEDYTDWYPGTLGGVYVIITGGVPDDCILQYSDDSGVTWETLATLYESEPGEGVEEGQWGESDVDFSNYGSAGVFYLRYKATLGGSAFYSDEIVATIESPEVSVDTPQDSFVIVTNPFDGVIYVPTDSGTVTAAYMDVYLGASLEGSYELSYDSTSGGNDYYSGSCTYPGEGEGYVVGRMTVEGIEIESNAIQGEWSVV